MLGAASKQSGVGVFAQDSDSILPKMEENANVLRNWTRIFENNNDRWI